MNANANSKTPMQAKDAALGRSEVIFVAAGLAIILGGLWLLYTGTGPYHPDVPVSENITQAVTGS